MYRKFLLSVQGGHSRLAEVASLCAKHADQRYILHADRRKVNVPAQSMSVVLRRDADHSDELEAYAHGWVLLHFLHSDQVGNFGGERARQATRKHVRVHVLVCRL